MDPVPEWRRAKQAQTRRHAAARRRSAPLDAGGADDKTHSVLRRVHRVAQSRFDPSDATWAFAPPTARGTYEILEVEAKSALGPFMDGASGPSRSRDSAAPSGGDERPGAWSRGATRLASTPGFTLNPYTGCSHACLYCYVPDVAHVERGRWGSYVAAKVNIATVLAAELRRQPPDHCFLSSATDCYQPAEAHMKLTRASLELLHRAQWRVRILTRAPLATRDMDLFERFDDIEVGYSIPTLDDAARRLIEPAAPPIPGRLAALAKLADAGIETYVSLAPAYPPTNGDTPASIAETFADAHVGEVSVGSWAYMQHIRPLLAARVRGTEFEEMSRLVEDKAYYRHFFARLARELERRGVACRVYRA
ncbi:MAG: SPL family radical SAM protein [Thermoplasmatota archaeon]